MSHHDDEAAEPRHEAERRRLANGHSHPHGSRHVVARSRRLMYSHYTDSHDTGQRERRSAFARDQTCWASRRRTACIWLGSKRARSSCPRCAQPHLPRARRYVGYDISPDGSKVVATREVRLSTGISYNPELALIDVETQERRVLARTPPREEFNGPIKWSPAGTSFAYSLARYAVNPARVHPGPHTELQTVCVIELETAASTCFPLLRRVFDFDCRLTARGYSSPAPDHFRCRFLT